MSSISHTSRPMRVPSLGPATRRDSQEEIESKGKSRESSSDLATEEISTGETAIQEIVIQNAILEKLETNTTTSNQVVVTLPAKTPPTPLDPPGRQLYPIGKICRIGVTAACAFVGFLSFVAGIIAFGSVQSSPASVVFPIGGTLFGVGVTSFVLACVFARNSRDDVEPT
jgi:hypothetical protein